MFRQMQKLSKAIESNLIVLILVSIAARVLFGWKFPEQAHGLKSYSKAALFIMLYPMMIGRVHVIQGIRPGVVAFPLGHEHWSYGANEVSIDGVGILADCRRGTGVHGNAAMRVDPVLKNSGLVDTVGGNAVFYQSQVKLVKV